MRVGLLKKQKGAVLILMFVTIVMVAMTVVLSALNKRDPRIKASIELQQELQAVKQTLLAYSLNYGADFGLGPGRLPCPDVSNTGAPTCNSVNLRRLPQTVTLSSGTPVAINNTYAGIDEQFWYAVTPAFKSNSTSLNTRSVGAFTVNSVAGYAAVIIAPGPPLSGQSRPHNTQVTRYLEGSNAVGTAFVDAGADTDTLNDRVFGITAKEVMSMATIRVAQAIKTVLDTHHPNNGDSYPVDEASFRAAMLLPANNAPSWLASEDWLGGTIAYTFDPLNDDQVKLEFDSCNIVFQFDFGVTTISRAPLAC